MIAYGDSDGFTVHLHGGRYDGAVVTVPSPPDDMVLPFFYPVELPSEWNPRGMLELGFHIYRRSQPFDDVVMVFDYVGTRETEDE